MREIVLREGLVLPPVGRAGRNAIHVDAVEAQIVAARWSAPKAGDTVVSPEGATRAWQTAVTDKDNWFTQQDLAGGYAYVPAQSATRRVMLLDAMGHNLVYVNGEPHMGDPYQSASTSASPTEGYVRIPVLLQSGTNHLLFQVGRGRFKAKLTMPEAEVSLHGRDLTLPDLRIGEMVDAWGAAIAVNATTETARGLMLQASWPGGATTRVALPALLPLSSRKLGFRLLGPAQFAAGTRPVALKLLRGQGGQRRLLHTISFDVRVRRADETFKRTFRSGIDGSIQYYAVNPARPLPGDITPPALFLTLHGASVEAIGQADAYAGKTWGHIVAPTNRRPYGFDWEDWGQLDALEVLELAQKTLRTDPQRTYLTGHSMGGHGAWINGATFPNRFAAIAPSAGWISFWSYLGTKRAENSSPLEAILERAANQSDTLAMSRNLATSGVYILHGDKDDNVPVSEARAMNAHLAGFHRDFSVHEEPGANHWWDDGRTPGAECVDWPPIFDLFSRRRIPRHDSVRQVDFITVNPGVSAWSHWAGIEAQIHALAPSSVSISFDPMRRRFAGKTDNVARLCLRLDHMPPDGQLAVQLDGQEIYALPWRQRPPKLWLARDGGKWSVVASPSLSLKGPHRYGPFKHAFRHRMMFVYGTAGTAEENAWAFAKARYDAEQFWYRGNGSIDVLPDTAFDASRERERGVILYGNAETNRAWNALLADSPVQVRRGSVNIGTRVEKSEDLACLFLRPRPGSDTACVGVVSGSGLVGLRLTERMPYFVAGTGFPDCLVVGAESLMQGRAGVRAAGFFGLDWSVTQGEFAWRGEGLLRTAKLINVN